jgi:preprotein translocase subunit SecD
MIACWPDQREGLMKSARISAAFALLAWAITAPVIAAECPPAAGPDAGYSLVATNAPPWDTLRIWNHEPTTSVAAAEAEVARIGGSRLLLEVDRNEIRNLLVNGLRAETIRVLRDARIVWANAPAIRGNAVEVRLRDETFQRALSLLVEQIAFPLDTPPARAVEISDLGNGLVRLVPSEAEVTARIEANQLQSMLILERRVGGMGLSGASVQSAGFGRIRAVVPGLFDPQRLINIIDMLARLDLRLVDTSVDACEAANGSVPAESEVVFREDRKGPVLVKKQPLVEPRDIVEAVVVPAPPADHPTVVFRLAAPAAYRFAKATQEHVGGSFAIVLDSRPIAVVRIAEPLGGLVRLSGGLGLNEAEQLSLLLRLWFPAKLVIVEQQSALPSHQ